MEGQSSKRKNSTSVVPILNIVDDITTKQPNIDIHRMSERRISKKILSLKPKQQDAEGYREEAGGRVKI